MVRIQCVVANISGGHSENGNAGRLGYLAFQAVQVGVNSFGFPSGVCEYCIVDRREDSFGRESQEGAGLDSCT